MKKIQYNNLDKTEAYAKLKKHTEQIDISARLDKARIEKYSIETGGELRYNYAALPVDDEILKILSDLADEQQLIEKYRALISGEVMNTGEGRKVLHHLSRGQLADDVFINGKNHLLFYQQQQKRINEFADKIHKGDIKGSTGKQFDTVVQIGIGGSDLGPRAMYIALENYANSTGKTKMKAKFISNIDPDDANNILLDINFEKTLFILVSKSGTTQETLTNREFVITKMKHAGISGINPEKHMIAVTSETSPLAKSPDYLESFYIDDYIGGRYSSTSAVGGAVLTLAFGSDVFEEFLAGAHKSDKNALNKDIFKNASLMDALTGIYERNILNMPVLAVLPYSQGLSRFPAHLQQLDMESNGKSVNRNGDPVKYSTGPVIFGEPGTNGQHSFYQLLHQGTDIIPMQFIGFEKSQSSFDVNVDGTISMQKLNANLAAQITAFVKGKIDTDANKNFRGNRPVSLILGERLNPEALGSLLAHFENKVMFQGFIWNINSFDQEGVQLGKVLTNKILKKDNLDPVLAAYAKILKVI